MKQLLKEYGLTVIFAIVIIACLGVGYVLEQKAFAPASLPGQAFAVVFTQDRTANASLTATVHPDYPWRDSLTVHVKDVSVLREHWLLVIECPPGSATSARPGLLVAEPPAQISAPASAVTVYSGTGPSRTVKLGCFLRNGSNFLNKSNTPGYASIGSVTLPALQTDHAIQAAETAPSLYAAQQTSPGPTHLIEVFPGASCPEPAHGTTQSSAPPSASPSPSAVGSVSPEPGSASATGAAWPPSPGIPGCFGQAPAGAAFSEYFLPASVQTKEILTNVNLAGYQVESVFPAPQIRSDPGSGQAGGAEIYTWNALSTLSPSLIVSNLAGQREVSHYTFYAGLLLGVAGGAVVTFLEYVWPYGKRRRLNKEQELATESEVPAAGAR